MCLFFKEHLSEPSWCTSAERFPVSWMTFSISPCLVSCILLLWTRFLISKFRFPLFTFRCLFSYSAYHCFWCHAGYTCLQVKINTCSSCLQADDVFFVVAELFIASMKDLSDLMLLSSSFLSLWCLLCQSLLSDVSHCKSCIFFHMLDIILLLVLATACAAPFYAFKDSSFLGLPKVPFCFCTQSQSNLFPNLLFFFYFYFFKGLSFMLFLSYKINPSAWDVTHTSELTVVKHKFITNSNWHILGSITENFPQ